jgi:hypothetical protein
MYLIILFARDGRAWLALDADSKTLVATDVTAVTVDQYRWRRLAGVPDVPGSGIYYYALEGGTFQRAPAAPAQWDDVLKSVKPAQA